MLSGPSNYTVLSHCIPLSTPPITLSPLLPSLSLYSSHLSPQFVPFLLFITSLHSSHFLSPLLSSRFTQVGEDRLIRFSGCKSGSACSIILRGASSHLLDEAERSLHDALCVLTETVKETR